LPFVCLNISFLSCHFYCFSKWYYILLLRSSSLIRVLLHIPFHACIYGFTYDGTSNLKFKNSLNSALSMIYFLILCCCCFFCYVYMPWLESFPFFGYRETLNQIISVTVWQLNADTTNSSYLHLKHVIYWFQDQWALSNWATAF
jgi:hypothetical protein